MILLLEDGASNIPKRKPAMHHIYAMAKMGKLM